MVMIAFHDRFYHSQRAKFTPSNRPFSGAFLIEKIDQLRCLVDTISPTKKPQISQQVYTESVYFFACKNPFTADHFHGRAKAVKDSG
jgi:hypothetical protein